MCPDKYKFIGIVIVVEVFSAYFTHFIPCWQNFELQGKEKKKKTKVTRKKFQGNKIQQNKIRKYDHLLVF
jgi:hypothetical protein